MEFIKSYGSDDSDEELTGLSSDRMHARQVRSVYLITYSQANLSKFPTRRDFATAVLESFSRGSARVLHWCCSRENHESAGQHYHLSIKLDRNQRWLPSKMYLREKKGISVHFSSVHSNYYSAWRYVTKSDREPEQSDGHPDLTNATEPRTTTASCARVQMRRNRLNSTVLSSTPDDTGEDSSEETIQKGKKQKRLSAFDVGEIIIEKRLKTRTELLALANDQKKEGKTDLAEFIYNRNPRALADIMASAWEMEEAKAKLERSEKSRMDILREAHDEDCVPGCDGDWLLCAQEILNNNSIPIHVFADAVLELLDKGRGKYRNLMIVDPANCGKTFLLQPLTVLYRIFSNPASGSFAWIGVDQAECIFLNDFRWSPQIIAWHDFLLMLEGQVVHLPAPKTHFASDIRFDRSVPIFCTGKHPIVFVKNGMLDERETEMMAVRWKVITFFHQIPQQDQRDVSPCSACFSKLLLN